MQTSAIIAVVMTMITQQPSSLTLEWIVWAIFVGILLGAAASVYQKQVIGAFVRLLIKQGATEPARAQTLSELGQSQNWFIRWALREEGTLRKLVHLDQEPTEIPKEAVHPIRRFFSSKDTFYEKTDMKNARFYIPQDLVTRAEIRYEKKGTDLFSLLITALVFLVVVYLSLEFIPDLIGMYSSFFSATS